MNMIIIISYVIKFERCIMIFIGSFTPKDKLLQKIHEKELISYKQTICRLEENNRHMLEEINNLKEALELHQTGIALHIEASGAWTNADI